MIFAELVHVCMFTDRLFFPWMVVPGRWRSPLRQGSWRQCPPPTLSLPQLSLSTHSHLAGSSYSRPRYVQSTVPRVIVCGCLCAQLQNPHSQCWVGHFPWQPVDFMYRDTSRAPSSSHFLQGSYLITKLRPVDQLQSLLEAARKGEGEAVEGLFRLHKVHTHLSFAL